jgi:hypothetical protein
MRRRLEAWLDGVDAVATTIYVVLVAVVVGGVLGVFFYILWHWDGSWGTQGEGFYLIVAVLLVVGWAMGELAWVMRRRRRSAWTFDDGSELPLPRIDITGDGVKATWGAGAAADAAGAPSKPWRFSFSRSPVRTFSIDAAAVTTARAARAEGRSWTEISRVINPDWDRLGPIERALFERALEAAVAAAKSGTP